MGSWVFFLILMLLCVFLESFFSMFEMASVSLNRIRLQYFVSKNNKRAKLLYKLLSNPSILFGTTIIAVNTVLQIGSESARRFFEALHLSAKIAPFTQTLLVIIFAEISPLFAARRYSQHIAFAFVPIVYIVAKILTPFIWIIDKVSKASNLIFGKSKASYFLTKEELQKAFEAPSLKMENIEKESLNNIVFNIFNLKDKKAKELLIPLNSIKMIDSFCLFKDLMSTISINYSSYIPIFFKNPQNIVAIAYPSDLLNLDDSSKVVVYAKPPWFVSENTKIVDILQQFRTNNQKIAVVLNVKGLAIGFITLDEIIDEILGEYPIFLKTFSQTPKHYIERTLSADISLKKFNKLFNANLHFKKAENISELITALIGHHPSKGEIVHFEGFEFIVLEPSILGVKTVLIKTVE